MQDQLWVFGYGSLIWDPCFAFTERQVATVSGWERRFCMWSVHYRGTEDAPGLVLALDRAEGAACKGLAFAIPAGEEAATIAALRERELISYAYREETVTAVLADGRRVEALTYVINRDHAQYAGRMDPAAQAQIIATRAGVRGPNRDYLYATAAHLAELGLADPEMEALVTMVRAIP
jgi:glutathione-specific gamma-glutamylcyclotransferase